MQIGDDRAVLIAEGTGVALAMALAFAPTDEPVPVHGDPADVAASPDDVVDDEATDPSAPPPAEVAQHQLSAAQDLYAAGDLDAAIAAATSAIDNDPSLAAAYLTRAQLQVARAGPKAPADAAEGVRWVDTLRAAADDLDAYLELALLDPAAHAELEAERDRLRAEADAWQPAAPEPAPALRPTVEPPPPPEIDTDFVAPSREAWTGPTLVGFGIAATAAGAVTGAFALRIEQRCGELCEAGWSVRPAFAASTSVAATLGTVASAWGTAQWIADRPPTARARRAAAGTLLASSAVATVAGTTLLAIATSRWSSSTRPSDDASLSTTQTLANAGVASLSVVPSLLASGLVTALVRRRGTREMARR